MAAYQQEAAQASQDAEARKGLLSVFARHPTAPNLMMLVVLMLGVYASLLISAQFFPDVVRERVNIRVTWSGASALDVDQGIIDVIEPAVRFIDNVEEVRSSAYENQAVIRLDFVEGADISQGLSDVESALATVQGNLPEDADDPRATRAPFRDVVSRIVLSGPLSKPALLDFAEDIRNDLLGRGLKQVDVVGNYRPEIRIETDQALLRRLGLDFGELGARLSVQSQDAAAGSLGDGERLVRAIGQLQTAEDYRQLAVESRSDGSRILLGDIASVTESDGGGTVEALRSGNPAVELVVQRGAGGDSLKQQAIIERSLDDIRAGLPANMKLELYNIRADIIESRLNLLLKNGAQGLIIVLALLLLFLNWRTAFWVAVGIPVSIAATIAIMHWTGQSLNMISMFALILSLGIIVDDAIVVGEHADALHGAGFRYDTAAVLGARRMVGPVTSSAITTIIAFSALMIIGGRFASIIAAIPLAFCAVLVASLMECFLIMPGHMLHALKAAGSADKPKRGLYAGFRRGFDTGFDWFRRVPFRLMVRLAVWLRYPLIVATALVFAYSITMVVAREVPFRMFVQPELNVVNANVVMQPAAVREDTKAMIAEMERAAQVTAERLAPDLENNGMVIALGRVGLNVFFGRLGQTDSTAEPNQLGAMTVELVEQDNRPYTTFEFSRAWQKEIQKTPLVDSINLRSFRGGPGGDDLDVRLSGRDAEVLKAAALELSTQLAQAPGVSEADDDMPYGTAEYRLQLTPRGRALGFDEARVGRQLRNALDGLVVERFARNAREVTVRLLLSEEARGIGALFDMELKSATGQFVPLTEIVSITEDQGFAAIRRNNSERQLSVTAELDDEAETQTQTETDLRENILPALAAKFNLKTDLDGASRDQQELLNDATVAMVLLLGGIYVVLAWVFGSFTRPFVVMLIIPVGFVGMIWGHWFHEVSLSVFSLIGFLGLTGIIVNDSIVLVSTIDRRAKTQAVRNAILDGTVDRLRAVILTSATTIGGLLPLLFETSVQAQFLIPTVITIVWGLALGTVLVLFVVPALIAIQADVNRVTSSMRRMMKLMTGARRRHLEALSYPPG